MTKLTAERLREVLHYDPETGVFTWLVSLRSNVRVGDQPWNGGARYPEIGIDGRVYLAHRLAVLYITGEWPRGDVDHINLEKSDNRWANLRAATRGQNIANRRVRSDSRSGVKGGVWHRGGKKWMARITVNRKHIYLGLFETIEDAHTAYMIAAKKHFDEFARAA